MKKSFLAIASLILASLVVTSFTSYNSQATTPVLDKMIAASDASKGLQITFLIKMDGSEDPVEGQYFALGEKFHFTTPQMKAWYDGKNLWVYLVQSGEVNLSTPMKEDLLLINPLLQLDRVKKEHFSIKEHHLGKGKGYTITATPKAGMVGENITYLTAKADEKYRPILVEIREKGYDGIISVEVKSLNQGAFTGMNTKGFFSFTSSKLPGTPVIDLR